jgi:hypothetical protein
MRFKIRSGKGAIAAGLTAWALLPYAEAQAGQPPSDNGEIVVIVHVAPFAELEFLNDPLLHVEVPGIGSTGPVSGLGGHVRFQVRGNTTVSVTAEPDEFVDIPGQGWLGRAKLGDDHVGYNISVVFPSGGQGLNTQSAGLPTGVAQGTAPLSFNLVSHASPVEGRVAMESHHHWTEDDSIPGPGIYVGEVLLTVLVD